MKGAGHVKRTTRTFLSRPQSIYLSILRVCFWKTMNRCNSYSPVVSLYIYMRDYQSKRRDHRRPLAPNGSIMKWCSWETLPWSGPLRSRRRRQRQSRDGASCHCYFVIYWTLEILHLFDFFYVANWLNWSFL